MPKRSNETVIDYLVRQRSGRLLMTLLRAKPPLEPNERNAIIAERAARDRAELGALSSGEQFELQAEDEKEEAGLAASVADQEEQNRWQHARADLDHWVVRPFWTLEQGAALLLEKDPRKFHWEAVKSVVGISKAAARFVEILELARCSRDAKQLEERNPPGLFLGWADRTGITVPPSLRAGIETRGIAIADWQDMYRQLKDLTERQTTAMENQRATIATLTQQRDAAIKERDATKPSTSTDALEEREHRTYLNIIGGLLRLLLGKDRLNGKASSIYHTQSSIIDALNEKFEKKRGLSKTNLEAKFAEANRAIEGSD